METSVHALRMDAIYGVQRHFYDLTRKYYLLGRDELIEALDVPVGGSVLEVGCGTGRNLAHVAQRYPCARLHGLDISGEMLKSARQKASMAVLIRGDAQCFDATALFGRTDFDRVFFSYALSMIPGWAAALSCATRALGPGGRLLIVDFGTQAGLPRWFSSALRAWLARFHVTPRDGLVDACRQIAVREGLLCAERSVCRDYAVLVEIRRPDAG